MRTWRGGGTEFRLDWAGRAWSLDLSSPVPGLGLRLAETRSATVLALDGLAVAGREDAAALGPGSLVAVELFRSRVQATYAPAGWGDLRVRASWGPSVEEDGVDLEVQAAASSVGELRAIEVFVGCRLETGNEPGEDMEIEVQPRDRRAAGLSYNGREPEEALRRLHTAPLPGPGRSRVAPAVLRPSWPEPAGTIVQMVHPDDVARRMLWRIRRQGEPGAEVVATRDGLFGHDLEKGVVVRGRLRVLWFPGAAGPEPDQVAGGFRRFLDEPPPLGM